MNLFTETKQFAVWFARLNKVCLTTRPFWTTFVIGASVVSTVAKLLAFLLPLKVILLAGSSGVPRYFAFFIDEADKYPWIIGLTAGAVLSYLTHLSLDAIIKRMAYSGGSAVLQKANTLAVLSNQEKAAQQYYERITGLTAEGIFLTLALILVSVLSPHVMLVLLGMSVVFIGIAFAWLLAGRVHHPTWLERNSKLAVSIVSSTLFLSGFLLLVWPYIVGEEQNLLFTLISLVMLKRSSKALTSLITGSISLTSDAQQINPLMFRSGKVVNRELPVRSLMRDVFQKPQRQAQAEAHLPDHLKTGEIDSQWEDQTVRGIHSLKIRIGPESDPHRYVRQHLYSPRNQHLLARELNLFEHFSRDMMLAPELYTTFEVEGFSCSMVNYHSAERLSPVAWRRKMLNVLAYYWQIAPPEKLIKDYKQTHQLLHKRFNRELLEKVRIAVENDEQNAALNRVLESLELLQQEISEMPLYIANQDFRSANTIQAENSLGLCLVGWGRWRLEPIGFLLPGNFRSSNLEATVEKLVASHRIEANSLDASNVLNINLITNIELAINQQEYNNAMKKILELSENINRS